MEQLKCITCGGNLVLSDDGLHAKCEVCGNIYEYKAPKEDYWVAQLNEANDLRLHMDFDSAINKYRIITKNNPNDAEAWWGLLLSKYGVAYEQDLLGVYIPTFHRNRRSNIAEDEGAIKAIENASDKQKTVYQNDLAELRRIQEGIEQYAKNSDPYDVFISFKATDAEGKTTVDRDIAFNIYSELSSKGIKTFFSEVTLREMAASDYESIIFNALNTCKVFILVCTSKANIEATWVKNEWTRYRERIVEDSKNGTLISSHFAVIGGDLLPRDMPNLFQRTQNVMLSKYAGEGYKNDIGVSVMKILGIEDTSINLTSSEKKEIAKKYAMAQRLIETKQYDKARKYYVEATEIDPKNMESWWLLHCLDNRIDPTKPLTFEKHCANSTEYHKFMKSNSTLHDKLLDPNIEKFLSQADTKLSKKINTFVSESNEQYDEAVDSLNDDLFNIAMRENDTSYFDEAVADMKDYVEAAKEPDYRAYLVIAYGPHKKHYESDIVITSPGSTTAQGKQAIRANKYIKEIFNSEAYNKAIELAPAKEKKELESKRDDILKDYDDKFKFIESNMFKDAMRLFKDREYNTAGKIFGDLINDVDSTNGEYYRYKYLSTVKMTSLDAIRACIKEKNIYDKFLKVKEYGDMIKAGGTIAEEAEKLKADLMAKNSEIIRAEFASIRMAANKAFVRHNYAVALDNYKKLLAEDSTSSEYLELIVLCEHGVQNRDELMAQIAENKSFVKQLRKNTNLQNLLNKSDATEELKKAYIDGMNDSEATANAKYNELIEKKERYLCKNRKILKWEHFWLYDVVSLSLLLIGFIFEFVGFVLPMLTGKSAPYIAEGTAMTMCIVCASLVLAIYLGRFVLTTFVGNPLRKKLATFEAEADRMNDTGAGGYDVATQVRQWNSIKRKRIKQIAVGYTKDADNNGKIQAPKQALDLLKEFVIFLVMAAVGIIPFYIIWRIYNQVDLMWRSYKRKKEENKF